MNKTINHRDTEAQRQNGFPKGYRPYGTYLRASVPLW